MIRQTLVVDASVAIKWVVPEADSSNAEALVGSYRLIAPQLIYAECANIVWKMMRRGELSGGEAMRATTVIDDFAVQTASMRELVPLSVDLSVRLDHAVYDCFYIALAQLEECRLITADARLHRKVQSLLRPDEARLCIMLGDFDPAS
ncbi:type II toxin-antitoxin system VapC family toxin [Mesorhizobium sp. CAU 1732]|uniref:type II toxin-antitoxin system VapC family toxin n=1 Tax=Mesorhizobium sp. CAU 1732 TaxID=3140358 RepID=UPI0032608B97